jgi:hypothetical protein
MGAFAILEMKNYFFNLDVCLATAISLLCKRCLPPEGKKRLQGQALFASQAERIASAFLGMNNYFFNLDRCLAAAPSPSGHKQSPYREALLRVTFYA